MDVRIKIGHVHGDCPIKTQSTGKTSVDVTIDLDKIKTQVVPQDNP